jgi:hypothetical protein
MARRAPAAHHGPIRSWDYLAISTIVPTPDGERVAAPCALCGRDAWIDPKGALYTAPNDGAVVCDDCGDREAPEAMALVRQLRACAPFTATVGGASLEGDNWAFMCPVCYREQEADERVDEGCWRIVDAAYGRPVCSACLPKMAPALIELAEALERLERANQAFGSLDSHVTH